MDTDIDIDVADRDRALLYAPHISAAMRMRNERVKHNTGVYF